MDIPDWINYLTKEDSSGEPVYLITGSAGTSKTTLASYFALSSCQRKESTLFFSFEESPDQLIRNMKSVGIDLKPFVKSSLLFIHSSRPSLQGLEMHLLVLHKLNTGIKTQNGDHRSDQQPGNGW